MKIGEPRKNPTTGRIQLGRRYMVIRVMNGWELSVKIGIDAVVEDYVRYVYKTRVGLMMGIMKETFIALVHVWRMEEEKR